MEINSSAAVNDAVLATAAELARNTIRQLAGDRAAISDVLYGHLEQRGAIAAAKALEVTDHTAEVDAVLDVLRKLADVVDTVITQPPAAVPAARRPSIELHHQADTDWAALYCDGKLLEAGEFPRIADVALGLADVRHVADDAFMRGQMHRDGIARDLGEVDRFRTVRNVYEHRTAKLVHADG
jgi:hypothetical protein